MARQRLGKGSIGPISVVPLGTTGTEKERVIPLPRSDGGERLAYPGTLRVGRPVKIPTERGVVEYLPTRWRGMCIVVDDDDTERGTQYQVRVTRPTKEAALAATEQAAKRRLTDLTARRLRIATLEASNAAAVEAGDVATTVGDLLVQVLDLPQVQHLAPRTREGYGYILEHIREFGPDLVAALPRDVDVAKIRDFMTGFTHEHGSSSGARARAILRRAFDLATESTAMHVSFNPVSAARQAIPAHVVRERKHLKKKWVPSDDDLADFLTRLRADPIAGPMTAPRSKSKHGAPRTAAPNPVDVADLLTFTFTTGVRIGEASGCRWMDMHLVPGEGGASINGTVAWVKGQGTIRQDQPKTDASERPVPIPDELVTILLARARAFGIDLTDETDLAKPVFGSPQAHDKWRNPSNLMKAVRAMFDKHGLPNASSHTARRWRITSLLEQGVPLGRVADLVGHADVRVTFEYIGRKRDIDQQTRAAIALPTRRQSSPAGT